MLYQTCQSIVRKKKILYVRILLCYTNIKHVFPVFSIENELYFNAIGYSMKSKIAWHYSLRDPHNELECFNINIEVYL